MSYLREYQRAALDAFWAALADEPAETRLAMEMATGLGKTVTGAAGAVEWLDNNRPTTFQAKRRVLILTHTEEITGQWEAKLRFATRGRYTVGVVKAERDEPTMDIVVGSVQTLANPLRRNAIQAVGLIVVDECHHAVAPTYLALLEHYGANTGIPALGLTATLARSDGQGLGHVWQNMVFSRGITWAQRKGFLLDVVPWAVKVPDIRATASDTALDAMLADSIAPERVVETWLSKAVGLCEECQDAVDSLPGTEVFMPAYCPNEGCGVNRPLPSTVVFAPLVKSAEAFMYAFAAAGIKAEVIHGKLSDAARENMLERYEAGVTTVLCNAMVLTEGWDSPRTMCVVWARPTTSRPLFIQGVGRGLRPWIGHPEAPPRETQRCVVISVTDTTGASLASIADLSDKPLAEPEDGKSLMDMEDEYDIGRALDEEERAYRGPVRVEAWDVLVAASSKAWKYTASGAPFLPTAKRNAGYVFVVDSTVYAYGMDPARRRMGTKRVATAPDISLAMALAEDEAQERGGDIGALLADKGRAWRKAVPSVQAVQTARRAGVPEKEIEKILSSKASGKAGKLSDLTDTMLATKVIDPLITRIRERATA